MILSKILPIVTASLVTALPLLGDTTDKWVAPTDGLKRMCPAIRIAEGNLILKTPDKGARLVYNLNGSGQKVANLGEEITLAKGQKLAVTERHTQLEIAPLPNEKHARFVLIVREDFRSFGGGLTVSTSVFDVETDKIVPVAEDDGRAALAAAAAAAKPKTHEK